VVCWCGVRGVSFFFEDFPIFAFVAVFGFPARGCPLRAAGYLCVVVSWSFWLCLLFGRSRLFVLYLHLCLFSGGGAGACMGFFFLLVCDGVSL